MKLGRRGFFIFSVLLLAVIVAYLILGHLINNRFSFDKVGADSVDVDGKERAAAIARSSVVSKNGLVPRTNSPENGCLPFSALQLTEEWKRSEAWLESIGVLVFDPVTREQFIGHSAYVTYSEANLTQMAGNGDPMAALVLGEIRGGQADIIIDGTSVSPEGQEQALHLLDESRKLLLQAVLDGGYIAALTSVGMSYGSELQLLKKRGILSPEREIELQLLAYRYGEATEALVAGLNEEFFTTDASLPKAELDAALADTVAALEAERQLRGFLPLKTQVPPERLWVLAQKICSQRSPN